MSELRIRLAVRGLIIDEENRVLLVRLEAPRWQGWLTPGGGTDGEEHSVALARELLEETGLTEYERGPILWDRTVYSPFLSEGYDGQREFVYLVECPHFDPEPFLTVQQLADENVFGHRWWTLEELEASQDMFRPADLARRVRDIVRNGPPTEPELIVEVP